MAANKVLVKPTVCFNTHLIVVSVSSVGNSAEAIVANTESVGTGEESSFLTMREIEELSFSAASRNEQFSFSEEATSARTSSVGRQSKSKDTVLLFE